MLRTRAGRDWGMAGYGRAFLTCRTRQFIAPIGCNECDGEAHVIRRAPYPFEGLEFRTFKCSECGNQMERVTPSHAP